MTYSSTPPSVPVELYVDYSLPSGPTGLLPGESIQIEVQSLLSDGSLLNLTGLDEDCAPTYRTSNRNVISVSETGLAVAGSTPAAIASAFVTVSWQGVTASRQVLVLSSATTTVVGSSILDNGNPAVGATVRVDSQNLTTTTDSEGRFSLPGVSVSDPNLRVDVELDLAGSNLQATVGEVFPLPNLVTDVGVLVLRSLSLECGSASLAENGTGELAVLLSTDRELAAMSLGLCLDPTVVEVSDVTMGPGLAALAGNLGPDLFLADFDSQGAWILCLVDTGPGPLETIAPQAGLEVLRVAVTALGTAGQSSSICFCDTLGSPAVETVVVEPGGGSLVPGQSCGTIVITQ